MTDNFDGPHEVTDSARPEAEDTRAAHLRDFKSVCTKVALAVVALELIASLGALGLGWLIVTGGASMDTDAGYAVLMAINALIAHILPAIVIGLILRSRLTHEPYIITRRLKALELVRLFFIAYGVETLTNLASTGMRKLISYLNTGDWAVEDPLAGVVFGDTPVRLIVMLLSVCVVAPIFEEIIFRGFIFRVLKPYGALFGAIVSAVIFGIYHGNFAQLFYAVAIGCIFSYVAWNNGMALLPSILLHCTVNLIGGLIMVWTAATEISSDVTTTQSGNTAYEIVTIVLLCAAGFGIITGILYFRKAYRETFHANRERSPLALSVKLRLRVLLLNPVTIIALLLVVHVYLGNPLVGMLLYR
jgi:membrane protease YdiL (CAAX protease family)